MAWAQSCSTVCKWVLAFVLWSTLAQATPDQVVFGPKQYLRTSGVPNEYTDTFTVTTSIGEPFLLHIVNGQSNGQNRISSAWITVNKVQVAGPADFGQNVAVVDRTISVNPGTNSLKVKVASTPGAYLTITVYGTKILPTPTQLTPNPLNLTAGASGPSRPRFHPQRIQPGCPWQNGRVERFIGTVQSSDTPPAASGLSAE